jgi:Bifunctional DNA primase/polymerase, N-terminal
VIEAARRYRQRGLAPIPVDRNKIPLVDWKPFQAEAPHTDQIDEWWTRWPDANVGVVTGKVSDLVVLDADGPEGLESLKALDTPATTWLSETGRGRHQWFKHPGVTIGNRASVRPHLDVRGDGGYVVAPPSLHASGRRYEWLTPPDRMALAPLPDTVLALLTAPASRGGTAGWGLARCDGGAGPARIDALVAQSREQGLQQSGHSRGRT